MNGTRAGAGVLAGGLVALLLLATLGEGGAAPDSLILWHAVLVSLLLFAFLRPRTDVARIARGPATALALFALLAGVGAFLAPYGYAAWLMLFEIGAFVAVAWLAADVGPGFCARLAPPFLAGALAQSALAVVQILTGEPRPSGTFQNPNHLAGWLAAALLLGWGTLPGLSRSRIVLRLAVGLPSLIVLGLTGSRGALLALGGGSLVLILRSWGGLARRARMVVVAAAALALVLVVASQARRLAESDPFRYQRVRIWRSSAQLLIVRPWLGTGPRQFGPAAQNVQFADDNGPLRYDRRFSFPHSDLLRIGTELGWPGLVVALALVASTGLVVRLRLGRGELPVEATAGLAAVVAIAAQALVDHPSHRPALYLLGAALWGSLLSTRAASGARAPRAAVRVGLAALLVSVFLLGDAAPWLAWRAVDDLPRGRLDAGQLSRLHRALGLNPVHPDYRLRLAEHYAGDPRGLGLEEYALAREAAEAALRLQPTEARYPRGLARVEAQACRTLFLDTGTRSRAAQQYERAAALARYDPMILLEHAAFLLSAGDPAGARRAAERALALEPEAALPRLILADARLQEGRDRARARELLREAEAKITRWETWSTRSRYAEQLLAPRAEQLDRLRDQLEQPPPIEPSAPGPGSSGGAASHGR